MSQSLDRATTLCEQALFAIDARNITISTEPTCLRAHTRWSWRSLGERIEIHIRPETDKSSTVDLSSDCLLPTTLFDLGKNKKNLVALEKILPS